MFGTGGAKCSEKGPGRASEIALKAPSPDTCTCYLVGAGGDDGTGDGPSRARTVRPGESVFSEADLLATAVLCLWSPRPLLWDATQVTGPPGHKVRVQLR